MDQDELKIRKAFSDKDCQEIKAFDTWQIFKIMAEFVDGFEKLSKIGPCVSIFGSARTKPGHEFYQLAEDIAFKLTKEMVDVMGGGSSQLFADFKRWYINITYTYM